MELASSFHLSLFNTSVKLVPDSPFFSGFAKLLGLSIHVLGLYAVFNSASNSAIFEGGSSSKMPLLSPNYCISTSRPSIFSSDLQYYLVISLCAWDVCSIQFRAEWWY